MPKDEPGWRVVGSFAPPPPESTEQIDREIERLADEIERTRATVDESFLSINESGTLITIGTLGLLGTGWVAARLLQQVLPPELIAHTDFLAGSMRAVQRGLGTRGATVAVGVGWLLLAFLGGLHLWLRLGGEMKKKTRPLAVAWAVGIALVTLPFYEFQSGAVLQAGTVLPQSGAAPLSISLGLAVILGIFTMVALLQRVQSVTSFFSRLGEARYVGFVIGGSLVLILALILVGVWRDSPNNLLAGILLASCLSPMALLLGIQKLTKSREVESLAERITQLRQQKAQDQERRRVLRELERFINPETNPPV